MVPQRRAVQAESYCNRDGRPVPYAAYRKPVPARRRMQFGSVVTYGRRETRAIKGSYLITSSTVVPTVPLPLRGRQGGAGPLKGAVQGRLPLRVRQRSPTSPGKGRQGRCSVEGRPPPFSSIYKESSLARGRRMWYNVDMREANTIIGKRVYI